MWLAKDCAGDTTSMSFIWKSVSARSPSKRDADCKDMLLDSTEITPYTHFVQDRVDSFVLFIYGHVSLSVRS